MAFFSLGGNLGYGVSPFFILAIVALFGFEWSLLAAFPGVGMAWLLYKKAPSPEKMPLPFLRRPLSSGRHGKPAV